MLQKKIAFLIIMLPITIYASEKKFIIGHHGCGFFSCFFGAINNLIWCEENNKIPVMYWDKSSLYFDERDTECTDNVWNCFFNQVSDEHYILGDNVHNSYFDTNGQSWVSTQPTKQQRIYINEIINKWIHVKDSIQTIVDDFITSYMQGKKTIGIHIRRTDKDGERPHLPLQKIFDCANRYEADQYLVATDDQEVLQEAIRVLKKPVIFFNCLRSTTGIAIHYDQATPNKTQIGREVLIEALLLSRTDFFIHTISNVSTAVIYFNPELPHKELF